MFHPSARPVWRRNAGSWRFGQQVAVTIVTTAAPYMPAVDRSRKPDNVERAIRIKSQDAKAKRLQKEFVGLRDPYEESSSKLPRSFRRYDEEHQRYGKHNSIREKRFDVSAKLFALIRNKNITNEESFKQGEEIFNQLSGFARRQERIYTAMVRLALGVNRRNRALSYITEMKKNGVAPSLHTYRALFQGMRRTNINPKEQRAIMREVQSVFQELEERRMASLQPPSKIFKGKNRREDEEEEEEEKVESSTAISYRKFYSGTEEQIIEDSVLFAQCIVHYFTLLLSVEMYDEALALMRRAPAIAGLKSTKSNGTLAKTQAIPQLPFLLVNQFFLFSILTPLVEDSQDYRDAIIAGWHTLIDGLQNEEVMKMSEMHLTQKNSLGNRREVERHLKNGLAVLRKFDLPNRQTLVEDSLCELYGEKRSIFYPAIISEKTLRSYMADHMTDPEIGFKMFDEALKYQEELARHNPHGRFESEEKFDEIDLRDLNECWYRAIEATFIAKDLQRSMSIMERYFEHMKEGTSRWTPADNPTSSTFTIFMRQCFEKTAWKEGVQVWQWWLQSFSNERRKEEIVKTPLLLKPFLALACRVERKFLYGGTKNEDRDEKEWNDFISKGSKPSRFALTSLDEEFGLDSPLIWKRTEEIMKSKTEWKNIDKDWNIDYLRTIIQITRMALDTGKQGADLADKTQVEKWKRMSWKAGKMMSILGGNESFDGEEADWIRSGVQSNKPLALTDADMRELLR